VQCQSAVLSAHVVSLVLCDHLVVAVRHAQGGRGSTGVVM
jgi:hypothetical protein